MKKRKPGSVLTFKGIPKRCYAAIHGLPRGYRNDAGVALLTAAADLAEEDPDWYKAAIAGHLTLGFADDGK